MRQKEEYIKILQSIKEHSANKYGIEEIGIFGSVARGEQNEDSDLDVFVKLSTPDFFIMSALKDDIEKRCGCRVDLLRLRPTLRPLLKSRIERDGIYA